MANQTLVRKFQARKSVGEEAINFKAVMISFYGEVYAERDWTMQMHIGALRNNSKMFEKLGADIGFDSMGDFSCAEAFKICILIFLTEMIGS